MGTKMLPYLMRKVFLIILLFSGLFFSSSHAQSTFIGQQPENFVKPILPEIEEYQAYKMDIDAINAYVHGKGTEIGLTLELGTLVLTATLEPRPSRRENTLSWVQTETGLHQKPARKNILFQGRLESDLPEGMLLAVNDGFLGGGFTYEGLTYVMEPLWHHVPGADKSIVIVYDTRKAKIPGNPICGTDENIHKFNDPEHNHEEEVDEEEAFRSAGCKEVEYASALDWSFVNKYNGESGAWDRVDLVMGLVEGQYTGWFNNDYLFVRTHEFASNCSTCDPPEWTSTTNSSTLLGNFRSWGQGGGFGNTAYDVAGLWTNRNFQNGVVGIAYVGGLCNSFKYHCLQDYSTQHWAMRVMVSHELGHNFNCGHDGGSGFIMSPSVNNTNNWSTNSINTINSFPASCLSNCVPQSPPVANFAANITEGCLPIVVNFTDLSVGGPTSWSWSFPGGTPATSTLQNPTVTYNIKGTYNVTLTASNAAGSDTHTENSYIVVNDKPVATFDEIVDENIVSFINLSIDGESYFWDFGDGNTSTDENPIHVYDTDGTYLVVFIVTNSCGMDEYTKFLTIVTTPDADFSSNLIEGCAPLTVQFEDQSTPNTTSWAWSFPGGTPDTSNLQNPVVVYTTAGTFNVSLTAGNSAGQHTVSKSNYITANGLPVADFVYVIQVDSVFFTVGGTPDSVYWEFGDGGSSSNMNPVHVYATEGQFTVTLTVFSACGEGTKSEDITIVFPPTAGLTADPTQGCVPLVVNFNENASPNTTDFIWLFPGGNPTSSMDPDPTVTYEIPGIYSVTLIAVNAAGADTLLLTNYINALSAPIASFTAVMNNGNEAEFTNTSQYGISFDWDFGDGNGSSEESPNHTYTQEGEFDVTLVVTNPCGVETYQQTVTVVLPPEAGFSANQTTGCAPLTVQFSDQSSPSVTVWEWTFEGGNPGSSTDQHPLVTYNQPGMFKVTLVVSNPIGDGFLEIDNYINVLSTPVASFTSLNDDGQVQFTNTSQYGQTFNWNFGDGSFSSEEHPQHTYAEEGQFVVTLTVTNECGVNISTQVVEVIFAPLAGFSVDGRTGCGETMTVQFFDQSQGQANSWSWTFEGGSPGQSDLQNPIVDYAVPGMYDVTLIVKGPGGSDTIVLEDYVLFATEVPKAIMLAEVEDVKVTFTDQSERVMQWFWDFGDGNSSIEQNPIHNYGGNGTYNVMLIAFNPCGSDTVYQEVKIESSSTALPAFLERFVISPNPSSGTFILELAGEPKGDLRYDVVNVLGQQVHNGVLNFTASPLRQEINIDEIAQGTYFLRLWDKNRIYSRMLQIQR